MSSDWAEEPAQGTGSGAGNSAGATPGTSASAAANALPLDKNGIPGRTLAAQREAMGWSVEQVADQLKMAVRQVIALEAGDYASLPGPAVVRGFVRAYAKVVKLDAAPLVAMIAIDADSAGDTTPRTVRRDKPASFSEVRFPSNGKRSSSLPWGLIGGVVVLVAAVAGAWQFGLIPAHLLSPGTGSAGAPAAAGAASQASVTVLPQPATGTAAAPSASGALETTLVKPGDELKPLQSPGVPLISVPPAGATSPAGAAALPPAAAPAAATGTVPAAAGAAPATPPAAPASTTPAATPTGSGALVLNVREDSWIDLRTASGKKLFSGLVKGGTVKAVDVSGPVTLKVGNAGGVDATLRGAAVPLPPMAGGTVAKVNLQ